MPATDRNEVLSILKQLARTDDDGAPVVSLFLDTAWDDQSKRDAVRVFVKSRLKHALSLYDGPEEGRESLATDAERITSHVRELIAPNSASSDRGTAVFASHGRGLWRVLGTPLPFELQLVVRQVPYVMPLARLVDEYQSALVCQVDSRSARIVEMVFGGVAGQTTIDHPDVPGRHQQGGWSQMRYQRHIDWAREQHVRDVADAFVKLADKDPTARLFVSGPTEPLAELRAAFPKRIGAREPLELGLEMDAGLPALVRAVISGMETLEQLDESDRVRRVLDASLAGQLAAAGADEVVAAVNRRAVSMLLVGDGLKLDGWRCSKRCLMGTGPAPDHCPVCGAACLACDLAARLVESVIADGGEVDVVHGNETLASAGGVAARLRFSF
jgi:peptide chain release factor subunit 1